MSLGRLFIAFLASFPPPMEEEESFFLSILVNTGLACQQSLLQEVSSAACGHSNKGPGSSASPSPPNPLCVQVSRAPAKNYREEDKCIRSPTSYAGGTPNDAGSASRLHGE